MGVYKLSASGSLSTGRNQYTSMLAGNPTYFNSDMDLIATAYGQTNFVDFSNIPQNYKHLQIRYTARDTGAFTTRGLFLEVNGNPISTNSEHYMFGNASSVSTGNSTNIGRFDWDSVPAANASASIFATGVIDILDYSSSNKNKTFRTFHGLSDSSSATRLMLWSGMWNSQNPITLMRFYPNNAFAAGSRISLYGIRG